MQSHAPPALPDVDRFLDHLATAGYAIGVRERLAAHRVLLAAAESEECGHVATEWLSLLEPLLARNADEQRGFADLMREFLREPQRPPVLDAAEGAASPATAKRYVKSVVAATIAAGALLAIWWLIPLQTQQVAQPQVAPNGARIAPSAQQSSIYMRTASIYVPPGSLPEPPAAQNTPGPALSGLRWGLGAASVLIAALLAAWVLRCLRQDLYLQRVSSDEHLEQHVLRAPPVESPPLWGEARVRPVSRMLRQRMTGARRTFDPRQTLSATVKAAGALVARYRHVRQTPEYLVLINRVSAHDHQAQLHELLFAVLKHRGVGIDVFNFEGTPDAGCTRVQRLAHDRRDDLPRHEALTMGVLSDRFGGHRLLVVGDASAAFDPITGAPASWIAHLGAFPQRVWLTPMPFASWSAAERGTHNLGFLLVPAWPEAFETVADWLASDRVTPWDSEDTPRPYPPTLRGDGLAWAARHRRPPGDTEEDLLFELRNYLTPLGFQWLCACAVFPALSWPLTVGLGTALSGEDQPASPSRMGRRLATLSALPWFRYGRMPDWLRASLVRRLDPERLPCVRQFIERRLADALERTSGTDLSEIAIRRRLNALFSRRARRVARDVVLAGFLEPNIAPHLAYRLPDPLRRALFRHGCPMFGVRRAVLATGALIAAVMAISVLPTPWAWLTGSAASAASPIELTPYATLSGHSSDVNSVQFSNDGRRIVTAGGDGTVRVWTAAGAPTATLYSDNVLTDAFLIGEDVVFTRIGATVWRSTFDGPAKQVQGLQKMAADADGSRLVGISTTGEILLYNGFDPVRIDALQDQELDISVSRDGRRVVTTSLNGTPRVLDVGSRPTVVIRQGAPVYRASFSPDGARVVTASKDGTARIWDSDSGTLLVTIAHDAELLDASFSPDGRQVVTASLDGTARVWTADGSPVAILRQGGVRRASFSPDGLRIVTGGKDGIVHLWGQPIATTVDLVSCDGTPASERTTHELADGLANFLFAPVVYPVSIWEAKSRLESPHAGEVWYDRSNGTAAVLVTQLVDRLNERAPRLYWTTRAASAPAELTVGVCDRRPTGLQASVPSGTPPSVSTDSPPSEPTAALVAPPPSTKTKPVESPGREAPTNPPATITVDAPVDPNDGPMLLIAWSTPPKSELSSQSTTPFTDALVSGLQGNADGKRDFPLDGVVDSNELAAYVTNRISQLTPESQAPIVQGTSAPFAVIPARASESRIVALVIGIDSYQDPSLKRRGAVTGARALARALGGRSATVRLLEDAFATRSAILRGFDELRALAKPLDVCIVYFAGYAPRDGDRFALVPYDGKAGYTRSWIEPAELRKALYRIRVKARLVVFLETVEETAKAR